jgi:hypothetical protein
VRDDEDAQGHADVSQSRCESLHDAQEPRGDGGLIELSGDNLDTELNVDGRHVEAKGIAREPCHIL